MRRYVRAKIHGLRVTNSALRYHGSVGIDDELLKAAGIDQFEAVDVVNLNTGSRWQTYALSAGKGEFCLNGGSARLGCVGDECLVIVYGYGDRFEGAKVLMMSADNNVADSFDYKDGVPPNK
ncbi:MAG: aspartate 1-decarboxylase [Actinobacteria bacterium]|nr:aspartate 1-decarboxylase [Actinomycetota bacterium]